MVIAALCTVGLGASGCQDNRLLTPGKQRGLAVEGSEVLSLFPVRLTQTTGTTTDQPLTALAVREQVATDDDWDAYKEFHPATAGYEGTFELELPTELAPDAISNLVMAAQFRGAAAAFQMWRFELFDVVAGAWVPLGDNGAAQSWIWSDLRFTAPAPFGRFVDPSGVLRVRYSTTSAVDVSLLDYLALEVTHAPASDDPPSDDPPADDPPTGEPSSSGSVDLFPETLTLTEGSVTDQPLSALRTLDESGTSDGWVGYKELTPMPGGGLEAELTLRLPADVEATALSGLSLEVQTMGADVGFQRWRWELFDVAAGAWVELGDNTAAQSWVWSPLSFEAPATLQRFVDAAGVLRVRCVSDTDVDVLLVDYLSVLAHFSQPSNDPPSEDPPSDDPPSDDPPSDDPPGDDPPADDPPSSTTTTLHPEALSLTEGSVTDQALSGLQTRDESGTSDGWVGYKELTPAPGGGLSAELTLRLPAGLDPSSLTALTLDVHTRGAEHAFQRWSWELLDATTGSWVPLGDNAAVQSWVWSASSFAAPPAVARFVDASGALRVRCVTEVDVDVLLLDYLALEATFQSPPSDDPPTDDPPTDDPPSDDPPGDDPPSDDPPSDDPPSDDPPPPDGDDPDGSAFPRWVRTARIGGLYVESSATLAEVRAALQQRRAENVSVVELDTGLSKYLTDAQFELEVAFLNTVALEAKALGLRTVVYVPSLEVVTDGGETAASSMAKDHPNWLQHGLDGAPNVFYGNQEHWVEEGDESAWLSPNSGYRDHFLGRIGRLAATALDGVWIDVPLYLDTGTSWAGAEPAAASAFREWSLTQGLGGASGLSLPTAADPTDPSFRAWLRWRHENLAGFIEAVRQQARAVDPDFLTIAEVFPVDTMDATWSGLDGAFRVSSEGLIRVWEVDSVSNATAMQWSSPQDFSNKLAMYKWARGADREAPTWGFSYGNQPLDAGLVMGAALATGVAPFETKTPSMTDTVGSDFRRDWFGFIAANEAALLETERHARIAVWYSAATRDYHDVPSGGSYGLYLDTEAPNGDPDWWASHPDDSVARAPHLGAWRGAADALHRIQQPYRVVLDPGDPETALEGLSMVWLPSVVAMSDEAAAALRRFVSAGGVLLATGAVPGALDDLGNPRAQSALDEVFGFSQWGTDGPSEHYFGAGRALYRPDVDAGALFDTTYGRDGMGLIEHLVRTHGPRDIQCGGGAGVTLEVARPSSDTHHLYLVDTGGLQQPLVQAPRTVKVLYRPGPGLRVVGGASAAPAAAGGEGTVTVVDRGTGVFELAIPIDRFALVTLELEPVAAP